MARAIRLMLVSTMPLPVTPLYGPPFRFERPKGVAGATATPRGVPTARCSDFPESDTSKLPGGSGFWDQP